MPNAIPHRMLLAWNLIFFTISSYKRNKLPNIPAERNVHAKNNGVFSHVIVNFWAQLNVPSAIPWPMKMSKIMGTYFLSNDNFPPFVDVI